MKLGCVVGRRLPGGTDFAALGENSLDTVALGPINWRAGSKESLTTLMESPGGQAATAAVACARLGWRSRYAGAVGDDAAGRTVLAALTQADVELCVITRAGAARGAPWSWSIRPPATARCWNTGIRG